MSLFFSKKYACEKLFKSMALMCVTENSWTAFRTLGGSKLSTIFSLGFTLALAESQGLGSRVEDYFLPFKTRILTHLQDHFSLVLLLDNSRRSIPNSLEQLSI